MTTNVLLGPLAVAPLVAPTAHSSPPRVIAPVVGPRVAPVHIPVSDFSISDDAIFDLYKLPPTENSMRTKQNRICMWNKQPEN